MIARIWYGWTTPANADAYEALLREEIFVGIGNRAIKGYRGIDLLRLDGDHEVEFVTVMRFDSLDSVRAFAGDDYEVAVVPPKARALLARFDARSRHYEVRVERDGLPAEGLPAEGPREEGLTPPFMPASGVPPSAPVARLDQLLQEVARDRGDR